MGLSAGTRLGPYEILSPLGAGGMGEVSRARDTRLDREVAIKVLPEEFFEDKERKGRFEREAKALAALNHPNIAAVYSFEEISGRSVLVQELLEGETLRERLRGGRLPPRKAATIALQVAGGLAAAHEKGIVHRDLKPENVFVSPDGRAKILDFGLARQTPLTSGDDTKSPTVEKATDPQTVLGTVGYMSPEQVRGQPADHRSDIFSFGCVLHEMLTGERAFRGDSAVETMNAILKEEPREAAAAGVPPPLDRILKHCLEKSPAERFQSARDLAFDLEALSGTGSALTGAAVGGASARPRHPAVTIATAGLLAALLAAGLFLLGRLTKRPSQPPRFTRLTFQRGYIKAARFAPDGKTVLYSAGWDGRPPELFETRTDRSVTRPVGLEEMHLHAVSRTGELALKRGFRWFGWGWGSLAVAPLSGSAPRELFEDVSEADWAPDGTTLAIVRRTGGEDRLEMPPGRVLVTTPGFLSDVRVSPDGRHIGFSEHAVLFDGRGTVAVVDLAGRKTTLTAEFANVNGLAWAPTGDEIWFSADEQGMQQSLVATTIEGHRRHVAQFPSRVLLQDIAPDGRVLLLAERAQTGIRGRAFDGDKERELGWSDFPMCRAISEDGRMLLLDDEGESGGLRYTTYLRNLDGSLPVRLGEGAACALSPDGRSALAIHYGPPHRLVLMPTGSGETVILPRGTVETYQSGSFLPDGRRIVFAGAERDRPQRTWVQEIPGGAPRAVTPEGTAGVTTSPDGRWVAAATQDFTVMLYPVEGGEPRRLAKLAQDERVSQWSVNGRTLFVCREATRLDVFAIDVGSGERRLWRSFEIPDPAGAVMGPFVVTRDARSYAYGYMRFLDELYLVEGLK